MHSGGSTQFLPRATLPSQLLLKCPLSTIITLAAEGRCTVGTVIAPAIAIAICNTHRGQGEPQIRQCAGLQPRAGHHASP